MSTESVKGSEVDNLTSSSDAQNGPKEERPDNSPDKTGKASSDSEGEAKIKADSKEAEKQRSSSAGSRSGSEKEAGEAERSGRLSRSSSGGRKSPSGSPRPKSSSSSGGEITFEAKSKSKRKKKKGDEELKEGHQVTFTVTISVAIPTVEDEDAPDIKEILRRKKRIIEASKAQSYYHLEYYLVPDQNELVKTDVVTYSMAAKIYMERHDPKVLKTWVDGDVTWVAWSHSHTVTVTKELLLQLYTHTLELRIWDTKDKVGMRAKFDRPKFFGLSNIKTGQDPDDIGGVRAIVMRQSKSFIKQQPKKGSEVRPLPREITFQKPDVKKRGQTPLDQKLNASSEKEPGEKATSPTPHTLISVPTKDEDSNGRNSFSRLGRLADKDEAPGSSGGGGGMDSSTSKASSKKSYAVSSTSKGRSEPTGKSGANKPKSAASLGSSKAVVASQKTGFSSRKKNRKAEALAQSQAESIKVKGICSVPIRLAILFSGIETITNRLENPVPGVEDMFVTLSLDGPLLNEQQKQELNPMIIKLHSITNLPETPVPYDLLTERCLPVHCKYSFFNLPSHTSLKKQHAQSIYWDDINVVLAGTFEQSEFRQYLNGPPLEIEVHDRDRKPEEVKLKASLFGDDLEDEKISNVGTVASRRTLHNPFKDRAKIWDPYGVAHADLSDLLLGHRVLYLKIPIHNCPLPDLLGLGTDNKMQGRLLGVPGSVDGPVDNSMPAGHYVSNHTMLKVKVELAHPLTTPKRVAAKESIPSTPECPFSRIVYKFDYKNTQFLNQIQTLITRINARALELDDMPQHVIDAALSTYKLSAMQQESRTLDIVTGFQVLDGIMHLFVLEGLRDFAVKEIWESLPRPENSDVEVLYNSDLSFSSRLYGPLDVDLCRVKLHEPLRQIVRQPLLYIRDMVPKPCFEALVKLNELTKTRQVRGAVRNELFPTADMVVSMSKEFGVPFTTEDFEELQLHEEKSYAVMPATASSRERSFVRDTARSWEPLDNLNMQYMEKLRDRITAGPSKNFIQDNMTELKKASEINKIEKEMKRKPTVRADVDVAYNYSTQALNSTELAKEKLRQILAKDADTRYTYCQDYLHSMTVVPVNVEALKKQDQADSIAQWKTEEGWIYPGMKTSSEDNVHPKKPHVATMDELREKWRENILHTGSLQPPLDRDRFPWELRGQDIELYRKPEKNFGDPEPKTIHLAGEKLLQEKLAALRIDQEEWKRKIIVDDTRQYFHRCLTETELTMQGRKASNQVARMQGLLKDPPQKLVLRKKGMHLQNIPPLNVVLNPSVDTDTRLAGGCTSPAIEGEGIEKHKGFKPGPYEQHSWVIERNKIPAIDYEHSKFRDSKGQDFNVYHKERSLMWRKPIHPLTEEERDNHLFRIPDDPKRFRILPELSQNLKERSLTQPQMSALTNNPTFTQPRLSQLTVPTSFNDPTVTMTTTQGTNLSQPMGLQKSLEAAY